MERMYLVHEATVEEKHVCMESTHESTVVPPCLF
jgi:hypothetical protein